MDWLSFIAAVCSSGALIAVALIETRGKKREKVMDHRAEMRALENRLSMQMMDANCEVSDVICIAVTGGHTNGNVERAQKKVAAARSEYQKFLQAVASEQISV